MNQYTLRKYGLLLAAIWPMVYFIYAGGFIYDRLVSAVLTVARPETATGDLRFLYYLHIFTIAVLLSAFILYSVHLYRNRQIQGEGKMVWLLGFIVLTSLAFLIYWWRYVRPFDKGADRAIHKIT